MKRMSLSVGVLLSTALSPVVLTQDLGAELQRAKQREATNGCRAALPEYERIAERAAKTERPRAAEALLRIAMCRETLKDAAAERAYLRVETEFKDQRPFADEASRRRRALRSPSTAGLRRDAQVTERTIWAGGDVPQAMSVSHDGRLALHLENGSLVIRDLATFTDRPVVPRQRPGAQGGAAGSVVFGVFSRDDKFIAYDWRVQDGTAVYDELRLVPVADGVGTPPEPVTLLVDKATDGFSIRPTDWSPDGTKVAVIIGHPRERSRQLAMVDVKARRPHVLTTTEFRAPSRLVFSPDGEYVAFDAPARLDTAQRDIFAIHTATGRQTSLVAGEDQEELVGWDADGRLIFVSDRQGQSSLWAQATSNGHPRGAAEMLRTDVGVPVALTSNGDLLHVVRTSTARIYVAPLDLTAGRVSAPATPVRTRWPNNALPAWSPDGRFLAYLSSPRLDSSVILTVHEPGANRDRETLLPAQQIVDSLRWSPDGRKLIMSGIDSSSQRAVFETDVDSLATRVLLQPPDGMRYVYPDWSTDAASVYFVAAAMSPTATGSTLMSRNLKDGSDHTLFVRSLPPATFGTLSPDRRRIALLNEDGAAMIVRELASGAEREVFRSAPRSLLGGPAAEWTPDGKALLVRQVRGSGPWTLWHVPLDGTQARAIDLGLPDLAGLLRLSNTGHLAFSAGVEQRELRVIEGLMPGRSR